MFQTIGGKPYLRIGRHRAPLPDTRLKRIALGSALMLGGLLWFLPILGIWMLPAGLVVLSVDSARVRRLRRRLDLRVTRWARGVRGPDFLIMLLREAGLRR